MEVRQMEANETLIRHGFKSGKGSAHTSRTIMLDELILLFDAVATESAPIEDYQRAILEANCLGKRSSKTRALSLGHLVDLYSLDPAKSIFRAMRYLWGRDPGARAMIALMAAYTRDPLLREYAPFLLEKKVGAVIPRASVESLLEAKNPGRFSKATLKSTAQNLNASFTKSGHLVGRATKTRALAPSTPGSVTFSLFLAHLSSLRGMDLFSNEFTALLDAPKDAIIDQAELAARRGWMHYKRIGDVVEVAFPEILSPKPKEGTRE